MSKRRSSAKKRLVPRSDKIAYRLRIEPLEARRLMAGLQVSVFVDQDGSRSFEPTSEMAAADRLVYLDLDRSGSRDLGEPIRVTDAEGNAFFEDLEAGDYSIGLLTNPNSQRQTTSIGIEQRAEKQSDVVASRLFASADLTNSWSVGSDGVATRLGDDSSTDEVGIDLGGSVQGAIQKNDLVWFIVDREGDSPNSIVEFDLVNGSVSPVGGLGDGENIIQLVDQQSSRFVLYETDGESWLARVDVSGHELRAVNAVRFRADLLVGSPTDDYLASTKGLAGGKSEIRLHQAIESESYPASILLDGEIDSLTFSADGDRLFAAMVAGGVNVVRVTPDGQLTLEAVLADATGPVVATTVDNRVITGNNRRNGEVVVWDANRWQPLGTSTLGAADASSDAAVASILADQFGDRALVAGSDGVYSIELAVPQGKRLTLDNDEQVAAIRLGVRLTGPNELPDVDNLPPREIIEDSDDLLALYEESGIVDPNGDALWYSLMTPPAHGTFEELEDGSWSYVPQADFFGDDSATLLVHDGIMSTELVVRWQIAPVNDPPVAVNWEFPSIPENPAPNTAIGFISVIDPDLGAEYLLTTSDPRFTVSGGQLFFSQGELDFEEAASIVFDITATDLEEEYEISAQVSVTLTDVNEAPTGISLATRNVPENEDGAAISQVTVLDPDASADYELFVSDDRFEIRDGVLQLRPGETLDYEQASSLDLVITAQEVGDSDYELSETIAITVDNVNEPPTDLSLGGNSVEADSDGAVVGQVYVADPDSDPYAYDISDPRFEIEDGILKLRDDSSIDYTPDSVVTVTVTATAPNGDSVTRPFPILVAPPSTPHRNPHNPNDVNGDGDVTPIDALILVNQLNQGGGELPTTGRGGAGEPYPIFPDVNGDGLLSPVDVLLIINELNSDRSREAEGEDYQVVAGMDGRALVTEEELRRRHNSQIDAELEVLLDQLSRQRLANG